MFFVQLNKLSWLVNETKIYVVKFENRRNMLNETSKYDGIVWISHFQLHASFEEFLFKL